MAGTVIVKIFIQCVLLALMSPQAFTQDAKPAAFDFTYANKGGYVVKWATLEFITADGDVIKKYRETQIDGQSRWEQEVDDFTGDEWITINGSSKPNYLRAKLTYQIDAGEKENCSQSFDPTMEAPIWWAWSKGTTTLKNRCRTKTYMLVPYKAPDFSS